MRISDWSSDVCSSDLEPRKKIGLFERITGARGREAEIQPARQHEPQFARQAAPAPMQSPVQASVAAPAPVAPEAPRPADLGLLPTAAALAPNRPPDDLLGIDRKCTRLNYSH